MTTSAEFESKSDGLREPPDRRTRPSHLLAECPTSSPSICHILERLVSVSCSVATPCVLTRDPRCAKDLPEGKCSVTLRNLTANDNVLTWALPCSLELHRVVGQERSAPPCCRIPNRPSHAATSYACRLCGSRSWVWLSGSGCEGSVVGGIGAASLMAPSTRLPQDSLRPPRCPIRPATS